MPDTPEPELASMEELEQAMKQLLQPSHSLSRPANQLRLIPRQMASYAYRHRGGARRQSEHVGGQPMAFTPAA